MFYEQAVFFPSEKCYLEKLLEYGYLKIDGAVIHNIVIFDRGAEEPYNEQLTKEYKC